MAQRLRHLALVEVRSGEVEPAAAPGTVRSVLAPAGPRRDRTTSAQGPHRARTDQNFLRGVQVADSAGKVRFSSIFPACYDGRWPHVHFEVYSDAGSITDSTKAIATSQVALPKDACQAVYATDGYSASVQNLSRVSLQTDNVFGDDSGAHQIAEVTGSVNAGYTVSLIVGVDTTTTPTAGGAPGGRGPGGRP